MMWPLEGIAVAVIGGIAFSGGEGNILGLVLGGIVMAVVGNCVNLLGLPARFQDFFIGFVIILAVLVDHLTQKRGKTVK
jgi:ribose/xylose/arabinose/galactoside ABC-type transport system permease subunit